MKFLYRYNMLCKKILLLRYGNPAPTAKSNALFSMAAISKHL
jgi:hypothetical protein